MNVYPFQPLDAASLSELKVALNGFLQKGETIKLETKVECQFMTPHTYQWPFWSWCNFILMQVKVVEFQQ